jgi:hypothetical protein
MFSTPHLGLLGAAIMLILAVPVWASEPAAEAGPGENTVSNVANIPAGQIYGDYESQIIEIFKELIKQGLPENKNIAYPVFKGPKATALLKTYLAKIQNHEMRIKNIVYRTDNKNIRITYGDKNDRYLFKIAYKTTSDPVLVNSTYADKDRVSDIKLIYYEGDKLNYVWVFRRAVSVAPEEKPLDEYIMNYNLTNERCGFCHELAKHDGSKTGLFFSRYQYKKQFEGTGLKNVDAIFREDKFALVKKSDTIIAKVLGDKMPDKFYYQRFEANLISPGGHFGQQDPAYTILLEMPELIEVLARDNGKSYCLSIIHHPRERVSNENYICADVEKKKLYAHYQNPWTFKQPDPPGKQPPRQKLIHYEKDFWDNPVMPYDSQDASEDADASEKK